MEPSTPRRAILALVERFPGLHVRELARQAGTSEALALYHLDQLVQSELIEAHDDGNFRRFYPKRGVPLEEDRDLMAILRRRVPLQIALVLIEKNQASHQDLTHALGLAKSTVSYHVGALERANFLRRDTADRFTLADPKRVSRLLMRWQPPQDITSRFAALWHQFYTRRKPPA